MAFPNHMTYCTVLQHRQLGSLQSHTFYNWHNLTSLQDRFGNWRQCEGMIQSFMTYLTQFCVAGSVADCQDMLTMGIRMADTPNGMLVQTKTELFHICPQILAIYIKNAQDLSWPYILWGLHKLKRDGLLIARVDNMFIHPPLCVQGTHTSGCFTVFNFWEVNGGKINKLWKSKP